MFWLRLTFTWTFFEIIRPNVFSMIRGTDYSPANSEYLFSTTSGISITCERVGQLLVAVETVAEVSFWNVVHISLAYKITAVFCTNLKCLK